MEMCCRSGGTRMLSSAICPHGLCRCSSLMASRQPCVRWQHRSAGRVGREQAKGHSDAVICVCCPLDLAVLTPIYSSPPQPTPPGSG